MTTADTVQDLFPFAITADEMKALLRFHECVSDGEGYDVKKPMMQRLAEIGLVRRVTGNIYEHTIFGLSVINGDFNGRAAIQQPAAPISWPKPSQRLGPRSARMHYASALQ